MRVFILLLMMVLLPARGWTGNAVATHAAGTPVAAVAAAAQAMPADCPMSKVDAAVTMDHASCASCALCLPLLSAAPVTLLAHKELPLFCGPRATESFASADPAPGFKPPIS